MAIFLYLINFKCFFAISIIGQLLPYPSGVLAAEIILLFILAGLEVLRIFFGCTFV